MKKQFLYLCIILIALSLAACGSSSSNNHEDNGTPPGPSASSSLSGVASKGPIKDGTVSAYKVVDGKKGDLVGTATTSAEDGSYSIDLKGYTGAVIVEVEGGVYKDEATGTQVKLETTLRAAVPEASGDVKAAITPLTEIAVKKAEKSGLSAESIEASNDMVSQLLGEDGDILETLPVDVTLPEACDGASSARIEYGLMLAALSTMKNDAPEAEIDDIIEQLEDDLSDGKLETTGESLATALETFVAGDNNESGDTNAQDLLDTVKEIKEEGVKPTGDLADAKKMLIGILNAELDEDAPDAVEMSDLGEDVEAFLNYMNTFVADSAEAHLMKAMALLADIYRSSAFDFITADDADKGWTGIGWATDFDALSEAAVREYLLKLSCDETIKGVFKELESRLVTIDTEFVQAEGVSFSFSLTGFDTVYFDATDVKIMRSMVNLMKAVCVYVQTVDLNVTEWNVTVPTQADPENKQDIRTIEEATRTQVNELYANNEDLFTYVDNPRLSDFRDAVTAAAGYLNGAVSTLGKLGKEGRKKRTDNAFNSDEEEDFYSLKAFSEKIAASYIEAFDNPEATLYETDIQGSGYTVAVQKDGYAYYQETVSLYTIPYAPAGGEITIYDIVNGQKSPRAAIDAVMAAKADGREYTPYVEGERVLFHDGIANVEWDDPIDVFEVPQADITIDGNSSDWDAVSHFYTSSTSGIKIKIARNSEGQVFSYIYNIGDTPPQSSSIRAERP